MDCSSGKLYPSKAAAMAAGVPAENIKMVDNEKLTPFQRTTGKVGRNSPCPCGSGKKFKRCCLMTRHR